VRQGLSDEGHAAGDRKSRLKPGYVTWLNFCFGKRPDPAPSVLSRFVPRIYLPAFEATDDVMPFSGILCRTDCAASGDTRLDNRLVFTHAKYYDQ
jgi:hypothetical protein